MSGLLGTIGAIAGNYFLPGSGALIGGALGGMLDGNQQTNGGAGATNQTQSRDPWAAAQPYMRQGLADTSALQQFYQKTPFNPQQIQGYSNLFGDIGNFRENVMPGLMNFANQGMSQGYQRGGSTLAPSQRQPTAPTFSVRQPQGLLDLNGPQYNPGAQIAQQSEATKNYASEAPMTAQVGQSNDPVWEKIMSDWNAEHVARFGVPLHARWEDYANSQGTMDTMRQRYATAKAKG